MQYLMALVAQTESTIPVDQVTHTLIALHALYILFPRCILKRMLLETFFVLLDANMLTIDTVTGLARQASSYQPRFIVAMVAHSHLLVW